MKRNQNIPDLDDLIFDGEEFHVSER